MFNSFKKIKVDRKCFWWSLIISSMISNVLVYLVGSFIGVIFFTNADKETLSLITQILGIIQYVFGAWLLIKLYLRDAKVSS